MPVNHHQKIAVLGAGAWGTAIACVAARVQGENSNEKILLWGRDKKAVDNINQHHQHPDKLGEILLPKNLQATDDINDCHYRCRYYLFGDSYPKNAWIFAKFTKNSLQIHFS